jgi:membrane protein implicated in regulation of membrane protease activity
MSAWLIWLIVAGLFAAAETASTTLVLVMFAGGAASASVVAALGAPAVVQALVAVIASAALLGAVRPVLRRHLSDVPDAPMGTDALVGKDALVLSVVDAYSGRVRLNGGEWTARSADRTQVLPAGTVVRVVKIDGATAVVEIGPDYGFLGANANL